MNCVYLLTDTAESEEKKCVFNGKPCTCQLLLKMIVLPVLHWLLHKK